RRNGSHIGRLHRGIYGKWLITILVGKIYFSFSHNGIFTNKLEGIMNIIEDGTLKSTFKG
ncbi:MAG: hypothetical protein MUP82_02430, partial [Candidatus Marinimicrobia bacterium]|nr:hypothetical protein [Candidatus Neomarinimicrobiota bacterium]